MKFACILTSTVLLSFPFCNLKITEQGNSKNSEDISLVVYYNLDSLLSLELIISTDSIEGKHCFTSFMGNRIDCCIEKNSLFLKKSETGVFAGKMISCLRGTFHLILIIIHEDTLLFKFINDDHEFMSKETIFYKSGSAKK